LVTVYIDGVAQSPSVTVAGDATYSFTPTSALSPGEHTIKAIASVVSSGKTNSSSFSLDWTVLVDTAAPRLSSISRSTPAVETTSADTLVFRARFDSVVTGVGVADFAVTGSTATVTSVAAVTGVTGAYNVTVSGGDLAGANGVVGLSLAGSPTLADVAGNALTNTASLGAVETYTLDNNFPAVTITSPSSSTSASITLTFMLSKASNDFDITDISTTSGVMSNFSSQSSTSYTARYTPASGFSGTATITVDGASFVDGGGLPNTSGSLSLTIDTTPPTVTNVTSAQADGFYKTGSTIDISVTFSEVASVVTAAGIPTLLLETGATDRSAVYVSGSGTTTLVFRYTVQAGDLSLDLDQQSTAALAVNGGTIRDAAGNNATLTLPAPGATGSLGANKAIVIDTVAPSAPTGLAATGVGGAALSAKLNSTNTDLSASATITAGQATGGSAELLFGSTVIATDASISSGDTSVTFTLGTATTAALQSAIASSGALTVRLLDAAGNTSSASAALTLTVDYSRPTVTFTSNRSTLLNGQSATITATLSETSTTFGTATRTISGGTMAAWSGSGITYTATFTPTAATLGTASISSDLGVWTDLNGNPSLAATALTIQFDTAVPTVVSLASSTANGTYRAGNTVDVTVQFTESVTVTTGTGTPTLLLETGTTDRSAVYTSGSGTDTLTFRYSVMAGDNSADLTQQSTSALALNGGVIADALGNNATLTLPGITSATTGSLAANAAIVIDTQAPSAPTNVTVTPVGGTVVANSLLAANTNMTNTATITAGEATGGYAELLLGSTVIATDSSIASGDTSVSFNLGLSSAAALQATIANSGDLTVRTVDAAGNTSTSSATRALAVDYTVPSVTITSSRTAFTLGQTALVTFTLSEPSTNFVAGDITVVNGSISSLSGSGTTYTATLTPTTGNALVGSIIVSAGTFSDAAGNANSASNTVGLTIDTVAPTISSFTSTTADGSYRLGEAINIRATFSESVLAGSTLTLTLDTGATITLTTSTSTSTLNGTYTVATGQATTDLTVSSYTFTPGSISDSAGNLMTSTSVPTGASNIAGAKAISIDTLAPTAATGLTLTPVGGTVISNLLNTTNTNLQASATITAGEATGGRAQLLLGGTVVATDSAISSGDTSVTFDLGVNTNSALQAAIAAGGSMTVVLEDAASNVASASSGVTLTVDYDLPTVTLRSTSTLLGIGNTASVIISTSESTNDLAAGDITATGGSASAFSGTGSSYSVTLSPAGSSTTAATIRVGAGAFIDANGNPSAASNTVSISVDTVAPIAPVITGPALTNDSTPAIVGTAEANSTVAIYDGGVLLGSTTANSAGAWTFTPLVSMSSSTHQITATATDSAGNTGAANSPAFDVVVDTNPPAVTLAAIAGNDEILLVEKDAGVTLSGTVENTSPAVAVTVNIAGQIRNATVSSGSWTYTLLAADWTALGIVTPRMFTVAATDAAGNTSSIERWVAMNLSPIPPPGTPDLLSADDSGASSSDNLTATQAVRIDVPLIASGSENFEAGQVLTLIDASGQVLASRTLNSADVNANSYQFTAGPFSDGVYVLRARISDGANVATSGSLTLTIDTRVPGTPGAPDLLTADDTGLSSNDNTTSVTTPTVRIAIDGVAISGNALVATDIIALNSSGTELMRTTLGAADISAGYVDFTISPALMNGSFSLTATAISQSNVSGTPSTALALVIDSSSPAAPGVPDLVPADDTGTSSTDNITSRTQPRFTVSLATGGAQANDRIELVDGSTVIGSALLSSAEVGVSITIPITGSFTAGSQSVAARIVDRSGNVGTLSSALSVEVITSTPVAPTISLATASDTGTVGDAVTRLGNITLEGAATTGDIIKVYAGSVLIGTTTAVSGAWSLAVTGLTDTTYVMSATATNPAGITSTRGTPVTVVVDSTTPSTPVVTARSSNVLNPLVGGTAEADASVEVFVAGSSVGFTTANSAGEWSIRVTVSGTGNYSMRAQASDTAGNASSLSVAAILAVDVTAPSSPTMAALNPYSLTPTLSGSAEANSTVSIYDGVTLLGTAVADSSGNWTFSVTPALSAGAHSFTATATDAAGNTGVASTPVAMSGVWTEIISGADGNGANNNVSLSASQYASIGLTQIVSAAAASLLNDVVDASSATNVDTVSELSSLADIVAAIMLTAAGGTSSPPLTAADFAALGLTGVTSANLVDILAAIAATANDGSGVSSLASLQSVVTAAESAFNDRVAAVAVISGYASGSATSPTLADFTAAGVTGVTSANLAMINSMIESLAGTDVDNPAEIQAAVDAYLAVLAAADGTRNNNATLTAAEFASLGMSQINTAVEVSLLNRVLDTATAEQIDTGAELQALGNTVAGIFTTAAGSNASPPLTAAGLAAIGLTGVTTSNLAAILGAIAGSADDGSGVDTLVEIQALIDQIVANAMASALAVITGYNGAGSQVPTLADYENAGITVPAGTDIAAINSVIAMKAGSDKDSISEVQLILDTYNSLLDGADGNATNNNVTLTASQYAVLGLSSIDSVGKAALLNDVIDGSSTTSVDTQGEIATLASIISRLFQTAAGENPTPALTSAELAAIGLTGVTTDNLAAVLAAIAATADNGSGVSSLADLQTITTNAALAAAAALSIISAYDGSNTAPSVADFTAAGVSGVQSGNLAAINSVIAALSSSATDSASEVQAVVDAYNAILNAADGTANGNATLTASQFQALGLSVINSTAEALLMNAIVDAGTATSVDTLAELTELARIADAISQIAAGGTPSPQLTAADLAMLGISGVTDANLAAVLASIAATADDGSGVNSLAKLQSIATAAANQATATALSVISSYAGSTSVPSLNDYANAGVSGVSVSNLAIINSAIAPLAASVTDSAAEISAVVDAYAAVIAAANGLTDGGSVTQAQFQALGLGMIDTAGESNLLSSVVDSRPLASVDTQPELYALGTTVAGIMTTANGGVAVPALTPELLAALGISGVTASNLAFVLEAYALAGASGLSTLAELQAITTAAAADALAAGLNAISAYDGTNVEPTLADFANAEVTGVTAINIQAVNSVLAIVSAGDSDTTIEIQPIVNAMQKVIVGADGLLNSGALLTSSDFASLGLAVIDTSAKIDLMNELIDRATFNAVDTQAEISALADIVAAIIATSSGATPAVTLTVASFSAIGITGINQGNLSLMLAAIEGSPDDTSGVNTLAKIQSLAAHVVSTQNAALAVIRDFTGSNTEPVLATFAALGVTGVDAANIAGINDYLAGMGASQTDSLEEIQALVDAYNALSPGCDALDNDNVNLTLEHWHALGYTDITTDEEVQALNDYFDTEDWLVSGSAAITRSIVEELIALLAPVPTAPRSGVPSEGFVPSGNESAPANNASDTDNSDTDNSESGTPDSPNIETPVNKPARPAKKPASNTSASDENLAAGPTDDNSSDTLVIRPDAINDPVYPQAPRPGAGIREVNPGEFAGVIGGQEVVVQTLSSTSTQVVLQIPGEIDLVVESYVPTAIAQATASGDSRIRVLREGVVALQGEGLAPNSLVDVTIFSEPTKLGVVTTDSEGVFSAELVVPASVPAGPHTIKLDGVTSDGELFTVVVGVDVLNPRHIDGLGGATGLSASGSPTETVALTSALWGQWLLLFLVLLGIGVLAGWWIVTAKRRNRQRDSISVSSQ
jgi:hypothetical protein